MDKFLNVSKSIGVIETASYDIFLKDFDCQQPFFGYSFVHHSLAKPLSMIFGIKEEPTDFIVDKGDKSNDLAVYFSHPCFCEFQVHITNIVGLLVEELFCQKRVSKFTCVAPG